MARERKADSETVAKIFSLKAEGLSLRRIAEEVGLSKSAVSNVLASNVDKVDTSKVDTEVDSQKVSTLKVDKVDTPKKARTRTRDRSRVSTLKVNTNVDVVHIDRKSMGKMALADLDYVMETALSDLKAAESIESDRDRVWARSQYLKIIRDVAIKRGHWGGLDEMTDSSNPTLAIFVEAMEGVEDTDPEGWEVR